MKFYRPLRPIQALSFDLDDTLYDNHPYMRLAERKLLTFIEERYPTAASKDMKYWYRFKREHLASQPELASDMGELRLKTLRSGMAHAGYKGAELDQAVHACFDYFYFERSNFKVDENICSLLESLSNKVPLVAITNGNVNLQQIGISDYFAHTFLAKIDQPMKPHPIMFERCQQALDLPASAILHVGDNLEKDVMGAHRTGFHTAWFACNRPMSLSRERDATVLPDVVLDDLKELEDLVS